MATPEELVDLQTPASPGLLDAETIADLQTPAAPTRVYNEMTGELGYIPASQTDALGGSLRLATPEEIANQDRIDENSGFGSKMLGRTEAFSRGATLGTSGLVGDLGAGLGASLASPEAPRVAGPGIDAPLDATGSNFSRGFEQATLDREARQAALGGEAYAWEALGAIAPAALSGGGTLGAKALAATPAALLERAGAGLAGKLGAGAAGSTVLQNALGRAAGGALEGAVGSAVTTAADLAPEVVEDPIGAAEAVGMSAATGLLIGGAAGGLFGAGEGLLRRAGNQLDNAAPVAAELAEPPPVQATADDIVAANTVRPMSAAELPAPQRGKIQELVDRQNALNGDYDKAADEASRKLWREMEAQSRDQEQFDLLTGIAAKRRANAVLSEELLAEAADPLDLAPEELVAAQPFDNGVVRSQSKGNQWFSIPQEGAPADASVHDALARARISETEFPDLVTVKLINARRGGLGKGFGSRIYADIADFAEERGKRMASDATSDRSEFANAWWQKRVAEGVAEFDEARDRYVLTGRIRGQRPVAAEQPKQLSPKMAARRDSAQQMVKGLVDEINGYRAGLPDADTQGLAPLSKALQTDLDHVYSALDRGDLAEGFDILDQRVRRRLGEVANNAKDKHIKDLAKKLYGNAQQFLEDEGLWGQLAQAQKQANPTWSDRITKSQDSYWRGMFNQGLEKGSDGWGNMRDVRSDAVNGLVRSLGDPGADSLERSVRTNLRASVADAANRSKAWGSPEAQALADRMAKRAADIENHLDRVALVKRDYLAAQTPDTPLNALRAAVSQVPVVGPVASAAASAGARASMGLFARAYRNAGSGITKAARSAVKTAAEGASKVARYAPMASTVTESKRQELVSEAQALQDMRSPQTQALLRQAARIEQTNPVLAEAMVNHKLTQAEYIVNKLPTPPSSSQFAPPAKLDPVSARSMNRTVAAISDPAKAVERMGSGSASPEDIDVVQKLFPATYSRFTQAVATEMQRMKIPPSLQQRLRIGRITGLNVDSSLERVGDLQARAKAPAGGEAEEEQPAQSGAAVPRMNPDEVFGTRADRILSGS
jgi:hypothetical protein